MFVSYLVSIYFFNIEYFLEEKNPWHRVPSNKHNFVNIWENIAQFSQKWSEDDSLKMLCLYLLGQNCLHLTL